MMADAPSHLLMCQHISIQFWRTPWSSTGTDSSASWQYWLLIWHGSSKPVSKPPGFSKCQHLSLRDCKAANTFSICPWPAGYYSGDQLKKQGPVQNFRRGWMKGLAGTTELLSLLHIFASLKNSSAFSTSFAPFHHCEPQSSGPILSNVLVLMGLQCSLEVKERTFSMTSSTTHIVAYTPLGWPHQS